MNVCADIRRVLIIGPTPPPYHGGAVFTEHILRSVALGERFDLVHLDTADRRDLANVGQADLQNVRLALMHGSRFMRLLLEHKPDLVYIPIAQNTLGYLRDLLFLLPSRLLRKKVIIHFHGAGFREFYSSSPRPMRALIRASLRRVRRVIVLGEGLRSMFVDFLPLERIVPVPNGIPDLFPDGNAPLTPHSPSSALFLSNLTREKGVFVVLEAARQVVSQEPSAHFALAGAWFRDQDRQQAEALAREPALAGHVAFSGVVMGDTKLQALANSALLVFPPVASEGFGLVILEAMSAGLPVVAARQGAISDVVVEGVTGYVVEPGDAAAVADRILRLMRDDELRQRMGQAGRERFLAHYTLEHCTGRLAAVFREVLAEGE